MFSVTKNKKNLEGARQNVCRKSSSQGRFLREFSSDRSGNIAILFALLASTVFGILGGAVDYGRWLSANNKTLMAMDTAVLAAGRVLQMNDATEAQALAVAQEYYERNKSDLLTTDDVSFSIEDGRLIVASSASAVATPFFSIIGIDSLPVNNVSKAVLAVGANSGTHIEVSMMLDVTGSMGWDNKMAALKEAAKDLVNIVIWDDQSEYTSRIGLAPFSQFVNAGQYFPLVTNHTPSSSNRTCVAERLGGNRYTDAAPSGGNGYFRYSTSTCSRPTSPVVGMTSNKATLNTAIDNLPTTGVTAGHLGTAWAWYLLSPEWATIWGTASAPKSYSLLGQQNEDGKPVLQKIAILMTDGEYNRRFNSSDTSDSSAIQARKICQNMKAKGITVYSVGFQIPSGGEADTTMAQCASSSEHYYSADDGAALKSAFRDIALKISTLRLSE